MNGGNPTSSVKLLNLNQSAPETKMDKVNGIDMQFVLQKERPLPGYLPSLNGEKKTPEAAGKDENSRKRKRP